MWTYNECDSLDSRHKIIWERVLKSVTLYIILNHFIIHGHSVKINDNKIYSVENIYSVNRDLFLSGRMHCGETALSWIFGELSYIFYLSCFWQLNKINLLKWDRTKISFWSQDSGRGFFSISLMTASRLWLMDASIGSTNKCSEQLEELLQQLQNSANTTPVRKLSVFWKPERRLIWH